MQTKPRLEQHFVAPDMARALRMLADELGEDAVLLSSRRVAEGVEIIGLPPGARPSSDDMNKLHSDRRKQDRRKDMRVVDVETDKESVDTNTSRTAEPTLNIQSAASQLAERIGGLHSEGLNTGGVSAVVDGSNKLDALSKELQHMKQLLTDSMMNIGGVDEFLPQPMQYVVMNRLTQMGLSLTVVKALIQTANGDSVDTLWEDCKRRLQNVIPTVEQSPLQSSGVLAVVGPNASGKTALIAKLVASQALEHDCRDIAVISLDNSNLPALTRLAELTAVAVFAVDKTHSFEQRLTQCSQYRKVLIDTGSSLQIHSELNQQSDTGSLELMRRSSVPIAELLVLPATSEKRYLQSVIKSYRSESTLGCVLSFFDQTQSLGELLSLLITEQLPLCYMSGGELLPEHLHSPDKLQLIKKLLAEQITAHEALIPTVNMHAKDASYAATG